MLSAQPLLTNQLHNLLCKPTDSNRNHPNIAYSYMSWKSAGGIESRFPSSCHIDKFLAYFEVTDLSREHTLDFRRIGQALEGRS